MAGRDGESHRPFRRLNKVRAAGVFHSFTQRLTRTRLGPVSPRDNRYSSALPREAKDGHPGTARGLTLTSFSQRTASRVLIRSFKRSHNEVVLRLKDPGKWEGHRPGSSFRCAPRPMVKSDSDSRVDLWSHCRVAPGGTRRGTSRQMKLLLPEPSPLRDSLSNGGHVGFACLQAHHDRVGTGSE